MQEKIFSAAVRIATSRGLSRLTRASVAKRAGVAPGSVSYHFDGMNGLKKAIVQHAVEAQDLAILASAIVAKHPGVANIPQELKKRALLTLAS